MAVLGGLVQEAGKVAVPQAPRGRLVHTVDDQQPDHAGVLACGVESDQELVGGVREAEDPAEVGLDRTVLEVLAESDDGRQSLYGAALGEVAEKKGFPAPAVPSSSKARWSAARQARPLRRAFASVIAVCSARICRYRELAL